MLQNEIFYEDKNGHIFYLIQATIRECNLLQGRYFCYDSESISVVYCKYPVEALTWHDWIRKLFWKINTGFSSVLKRSSN